MAFLSGKLGSFIDQLVRKHEFELNGATYFYNAKTNLHVLAHEHF